MSEIICTLCESDSAVCKVEILFSDEVFYPCLSCLKLTLKYSIQHGEIDKIFTRSMEN